MPTDPEIAHALRDAVERGSEQSPPAPPAGGTWYLIRRATEAIGVLYIRCDVPTPGAATVDVIAIAPAARGGGTGTWALQLVERRLRREVQGDAPPALYARVSRTNGRGFYFMLRAGFRPIAAPPAEQDSASQDSVPSTWFERAGRG